MWWLVIRALIQGLWFQKLQKKIFPRKAFEMKEEEKIANSSFPLQIQIDFLFLLLKRNISQSFILQGMKDSGSNVHVMWYFNIPLELQRTVTRFVHVFLFSLFFSAMSFPHLLIMMYHYVIRILHVIHTALLHTLDETTRNTREKSEMKINY